MPPLSRRQQATIVALVDRQAATTDTLTQRLLELVRRLVRSLRGDAWYDDAQVAAMADALARVVRTGQTTRANTTRAYLDAVMRQMGAPEPRRQPLSLPDNFADGVTLRGEFERVAKTYRRARVNGLDELEALEAAERRATSRADMDLKRAASVGQQKTLQAWGVDGWRRVIRPYLSASGVCGLCVAASDRTYKSGDLMAIHANCKCVALPIVEIGGVTYDPGDGLNADTLRALYAAAGSTSAIDLKRLRFAVRTHGELGPLLVNADHEFRGPADVAA